MLMGVYYANYDKNCKSNYWDMEKKSIPYAVKFTSNEAMHQYMNTLQYEGLRCVASNQSYTVLLINLELKTFGVIDTPCKHQSVDDKLYTLPEFVAIYSKWKENSHESKK